MPRFTRTICERLPRLRRVRPEGQDVQTLQLALTSKIVDQEVLLHQRQQDLQEVLSAERSLTSTGVETNDRVTRRILVERRRQYEREVEALGAAVISLQRWLGSLSAISTNECAVVPWETATRIQDWLRGSTVLTNENLATIEAIGYDLELLVSQHRDVIMVEGEDQAAQSDEPGYVTRNARAIDIEEGLEQLAPEHLR